MMQIFFIIIILNRLLYSNFLTDLHTRFDYDASWPSGVGDWNTSSFPLTSFQPSFPLSYRCSLGDVVFFFFSCIGCSMVQSNKYYITCKKCCDLLSERFCFTLCTTGGQTIQQHSCTCSVTFSSVLSCHTQPFLPRLLKVVVDQYSVVVGLVPSGKWLSKRCFRYQSHLTDYLCRQATLGLICLWFYQSDEAASENGLIRGQNILTYAHVEYFYPFCFYYIKNVVTTYRVLSELFFRQHASPVHEAVDQWFSKWGARAGGAHQIGGKIRKKAPKSNLNFFVVVFFFF